MPEVEECIFIERPPEAVFRFATEPANVPRFSPNVLEYERLDEGILRVGSRVRGTAKVAGRRVDYIYEVTEFNPPERYVIRAVESPISFRVTQRYEATDEGTLVDWHTESDGYGGFFGKLAESVVTSMYARDVKSNLRTLKELLEVETP